MMLGLLAALALAQASPEPVSTGEGPVRSLLSGEPLPTGSSFLLGFAGYPALGFAYAQGFSFGDGGLDLTLRWDTGEMEAAGLTRLPLWRGGAAALGFRARLGLYACWASAAGPYAHRPDVGLLAAPGLALSVPTGPGLFSAGLDVRAAITTRRGWGAFAAPALSAAYEVPLVGDVTVGARLAVGRRWDGGGAPGALRSPDNFAELLLLIGYRLL